MTDELKTQPWQPALCATCPAWEQAEDTPTTGQCRLMPEPFNKAPHRWCVQHPQNQATFRMLICELIKQEATRNESA